MTLPVALAHMLTSAALGRVSRASRFCAGTSLSWVQSMKRAWTGDGVMRWMTSLKLSPSGRSAFAWSFAPGLESGLEMSSTSKLPIGRPPCLWTSRLISAVLHACMASRTSELRPSRFTKK